MGKDGDKKASQKMELEELKEAHVRLVQQEKELSAKVAEVKGIFQQLEDTYQGSKGTFSVQRYGQLKDMIKNATSDQRLKEIQDFISSSDSKEKTRSGLTSLLQRAKDFSGESQQTQTEASGKSEKKPGKFGVFMKKLKNATGFSDDPITDEDVMSQAELERDNARKQRAIQHYRNQCCKALEKLQHLKKAYEQSKAHSPPKRYQDLKDMIKSTVAEKVL